MIKALFVTCLLSDPARCQDQNLLFRDQNGLMTCMLQSQSEPAHEIDFHPREQVRQWKRRYAGQTDHKT